MVITVVTIVAASVIITIFGERNFFFLTGAGLQPPRHASASEEVKTLFSDSISGFKNQNAPMSDFFQAPIPSSHDDRVIGCSSSFRYTFFMVWPFKVKTHYHCRL